ncbi:MAG: hypothetical protein NVSMB2_04310 [Chloroflexota bacterium]
MVAQQMRTTADRGAVAPIRLQLLEPPDSPAFARIAGGAALAGLTVQSIQRPEEIRPSAQFVVVGPGHGDPLDVARYLRQINSHALLLLLVASDSRRADLQAELIRDPFLYARWELVELPATTRQVAARMHSLVSSVRRTSHPTPTLGRGRRRPSRTSVAQNRASDPAPTENHLANVLAQSQDAILSIDNTLTIQTWNRACARIFGVAERDMVGHPLSLINAECEGDTLVGAAQRVLSDHEVVETRITCRSSGDESLILAVTIIPVQDASGTIAGLSLIARDDSAYRRIEDALRDANRQKDEFLAIMSHELRTPLTSILGYTDMLLRGLSGPLPPLTNKYLGNVRSAGDRLLDLVNGLLDFTRLEAGAEAVEPRPVDLPRLVGQVVAQCRTYAQHKRIDVRMSVSRGVPARIEADEEKLVHVIKAMMANAIKFTPDAGSIGVKIEPDPEVRDSVRVSITDTGIGMTQEVQPRVWDRFYQGDASLTRPYGGMGLGLSIARHLVALHGGTVRATSPGPGCGSTFWFSLPRSRAT